MSELIQHPRDRLSHHAARVLVHILPRFRPNGRIAPVGGEDESQLTCLLSQEVIYGLAAMTNLDWPLNPIRDDHVLRQHAIDIGDYLAMRFGTRGAVTVKSGIRTLENIVPTRLIHYWILATEELRAHLSAGQLTVWQDTANACLQRLRTLERERWEKASGRTDVLSAGDGLNSRFLTAAVLCSHGLNRSQNELVDDGMEWMDQLLSTVTDIGYVDAGIGADWYDTWLSAYGLDLYYRSTADPRANLALARMLDFLADHIMDGGSPPPPFDRRYPAGQKTYSGYHTFVRWSKGRRLAMTLTHHLAWPDKPWGVDYRTVRRSARLAESARLWFEPQTSDSLAGASGPDIDSPPAERIEIEALSSLAWRADPWKAVLRGAASPYEDTSGSPIALPDDTSASRAGANMLGVSSRDFGLVFWSERCGARRNNGAYLAVDKSLNASIMTRSSLRGDSRAVGLLGTHSAFDSETWLQIIRPDILDVHMTIQPKMRSKFTTRLNICIGEDMRIGLKRGIYDMETFSLSRERFRLALLPDMILEWRCGWRPGGVRLRIVHTPGREPAEIVWYSTEKNAFGPNLDARIMYLECAYPEKGGTLEMQLEAISD